MILTADTINGASDWFNEPDGLLYKMLIVYSEWLTGWMRFKKELPVSIKKSGQFELAFILFSVYFQDEGEDAADKDNDEEEDGFFVPHGYLSDGEGCEDDEEDVWEFVNLSVESFKN